MKKIYNSIQHALRPHAERNLTIATLITIFSGTVFYHFIEKWSWLDAMYFSITTLATVGYGDIHPVTVIGKIFTMFYIIIGVGIIFGFINAIYKRSDWK
jgi:voltage-gated potassium channel